MLLLTIIPIILICGRIATSMEPTILIPIEDTKMKQKEMDETTLMIPMRYNFFAEIHIPYNTESFRPIID